MEKRDLSLESISSNGVLIVKDYERLNNDIAQELEESYQVFEINSEEEYQELKKKRVRINHLIDSLDTRRKDVIKDTTLTFNEQCKALINILDARQKAIGDELKKWKDSQKEVVVDTKKKIVATIKYYDEKISKKLEDFCKKNNCELTIK